MVAANKFVERIAENLTATISSGQTESTAVPLYGCNMVALIMPASFTGTTVTFKGSNDGTNYVPLYNASGTQLSASVGTSRAVCFTASDFAGWKYIKIISGSSEGGDREIEIVARSL